MKSEKQYIGVTLLFYKQEKTIYQAIISSYILLLGNYRSFVFDVKKLTDKLLVKEFYGYTFIGITDLYVAEKEGYKKFLGRTSFFEKKQMQDAEKLVLSQNHINKILTENNEKQKYNISLVYFNNDSEGAKFNSTMIIYSKLRNIENIEQISEFADSKSFKKKIIKFSVEQLKVEDLKYVGIIDFYPIQDQGMFSYERYFNSISSINEEIIIDSELRKKFNEVLKDYRYVS